MKKEFDRQIFNIILIHVAREWERIRLTQPYEEMPYDNIESTEKIEHIATEIINNDLMQDFLTTDNQEDFFIRKTDSMSDMYIEEVANNYINQFYINNQNK